VAAKQLGVFVAQLPGERVGLLLHAQVAFTLPRERIPTVRAVRVTASFARDGFRTHVYRLLGPKRAARVQEILEALPVIAPSFAVISCPAQFGMLRLELRSRRGGRGVARATLPVGGCGGVSLTVEGNEQPSLGDDTKPGLLETLRSWLHLPTGY